MLSTPPAFILSQDQTLVKSVCLGPDQLLANPSLYCVWFRFDCPSARNQVSRFAGSANARMRLTWKMNFPSRRLARAVSAVRKIFSSKKFSRVVVYCSVIKVLAVLSCDSFDILSNLFRFVKNFFIFFCLPFPLPSRSASSDSLYRLSHRRAVVNHFFQVVSSSRQVSSTGSPPSDRSASASSAGCLFLFLSPSSATGVILSPQKGIVNVFLVFYLFQTIQTIHMFLPCILLCFYMM